MAKQIKNPYVLFRRYSKGPYASKLGGGAYAKTFNVGAGFRIVSAQIGDPWPDQIYLTYNDDFNDTTCSVALDWNFQYSGNNFESVTPLAPVSSKVDAWETANTSDLEDGAGPQDNVTYSYTPGTCAASGDPGDSLGQIPSAPVTNRILGPTSLEIGDFGDDTIVVDYPVDMTAVGAVGTWIVEDDESVIAGTTAAIVGGNIHITLTAPAEELDNFFVTHKPTITANGAQGSDGRYSYRYFGKSVTNNIDVTAPSVPTGLVATATGAQTINLTWNASTDNKSGVKGYNIFRNDGGFEYRFVDDRIDLPIPSLTGTSPGRIEVTVRPDDFRGAGNQVIFEGNGGTWLRCFYFAEDETYRFRAFSNDNTISSYDIDVQSPNEVTHICRWKANSGGSTYEVGAETDTGISGVSTAHNTLYIGRRENGLAPFKGVIKEIKYYDAEFGGNLVHYWKIDDNSSTIADSQGSADGTLQAGGSGSWQGGYIDFVEHPTTTYDDTGLTAETTYTYTVSAVDNKNNESAQSASDNATTFAPAPNVTAAEVGNVADNIVVVTFDREVVATNYTTGWSFTENGSGRAIQSSAKTAATEVRFTLTADISEGTTVAYNYNASAGNYENTDGVAMENQSGSVTNNVLPPVSDPDFEAFTVDANGKILTLKTGTGSVTFARAAEATVKSAQTDSNIITKRALVNELRYDNARRVYNELESATEQSRTENYNQKWRDETFSTFPLIDVSGGTIFSEAWRGCANLTSFPLLDVSQSTNFFQTWIFCTGLTSFPNLDVSQGTIFNGAWRGCTSLTSFPSLDVGQGEEFRDAWRQCTSLTSFPALNFSQATTLFQAWYACTSLADFPANVFDTCTATNFVNAFFNCALTQTSVDNILVSLDAAGQSNGTVDITGGTSAAPGAAGQAAKTNLQGKGWTVNTN